jgi:hypothetical protein
VHGRDRSEPADVDVVVEQQGADGGGGDQEGDRIRPLACPDQDQHGCHRGQYRLSPEQVISWDGAVAAARGGGHVGREVPMDVGIGREPRGHEYSQHDFHTSLNAMPPRTD